VPGAAQFDDQRGDVLDPEPADLLPAEAGQEVVVEVEAVGLMGAGPALSGRHHRRALAPARRHGVEAWPGRAGTWPAASAAISSSRARLAPQVASRGAEMKSPGAAAQTAYLPFGWR
jgi:hypothetical protein